MEPFLVFLLVVFAVLMGLVNGLFLWWQKRDHEKLKRKRGRK